MKQMTISFGGFDRHGKTTRRAVFLSEMDRVVPLGWFVRADRAGLPQSGKRTSTDWP